MKVLVTGAAGFIGSHVCERLLERGDAVVGLDNFNDYYSPAAKRANAALLERRPGFRMIEGDVRDAPLVRTTCEAERFDGVVHIAAMANVRYSLQDPLLYVDVNVRGLVSVLEGAVAGGARDFVFASTSSVYGRTDRIPFRETDSTDQPLAPYPATKKAGEAMLHAYHVAHGLRCRVLRFFNVYGPRGRPDMTPWHFLEAILRGDRIRLFDEGRPQRDWTYVDDTVRGVVAALDAGHGYEIFNLGRGEPVAMSEFVGILERLAGRPALIDPAPLPPTEALVTYSDTTKAARMLGYRPEVSLEEGLRRFFEWFQEKLKVES